MRVKLHTNLAGPKGAHHAGSVISVDDAHGKDLVEGGYAEETDAPEMAAVVPPETANILPQRGRRPPKAKPAQSPPQK